MEVDFVLVDNHFSERKTSPLGQGVALPDQSLFHDLFHFPAVIGRVAGDAVSARGNQ
jgi:hypothetical protein